MVVRGTRSLSLDYVPLRYAANEEAGLTLRVRRKSERRQLFSLFADHFKRIDVASDTGLAFCRPPLNPRLRLHRKPPHQLSSVALETETALKTRSPATRGKRKP